MPNKRNCPSIPLSKQPLALVLIQARFSNIPYLDKNLPEIQDVYRRLGFPLMDRVQALSWELRPEGPFQTAIVQWRFTRADGKTSIILDQNQILLQTSVYTSFEAFISDFMSMLGSLMRLTEHDTLGLIQRLGLRYVDQVVPQYENDTVDSYLRPELRGMEAPLFSAGGKRYTFALAGNTDLGSEKKGSLMLRVIRGEKGIDLPPDIIAIAPLRTKGIPPESDRALIDMDHAWENNLGVKFDGTEIERVFFRLHDDIINVLHESVVTEEGIKKWK
jgi:uncharacterized protein (TIGR04255 family)